MARAKTCWENERHVVASGSGKTSVAKKLYLGPFYVLGESGLTRVEDASVLDMLEEAVLKVNRQFRERLQAKEQSIKQK